jgi:hypothetical protein
LKAPPRTEKWWGALNHRGGVDAAAEPASTEVGDRRFEIRYAPAQAGFDPLLSRRGGYAGLADHTTGFAERVRR